MGAGENKEGGGDGERGKMKHRIRRMDSS